MNLQQDTCLQPIIGHSGSDSRQQLLTLLKTRSGSAVLDGSVDSIRSGTLMFGKNCDGHALSALTGVVYCAFSLVFNCPSTSVTTTWIHLRQLLVYLKCCILVNCYSDLSSLFKLSWYQASTCKRLALMGPETMTDVVYYDVQHQWYVDINAVKLTRIVRTDIGTNDTVTTVQPVDMTLQCRSL